MAEFKLNEGQEFTLSALSNFEDTYVLKGYAGTGKTTVITRWVRQIRQRPKDLDPKVFWRAPSIVLTAPTNKATSVLKEMANEIKLPVEVKTIHSLLCLKIRWQKDQQVLVKDDYADDMFGTFTHVVIDESSMLDSTLMKHIREAQKRAKNKVIFMGDPCQLPPIGEKESESFKESENISELTEVMRQSGRNNIPELALYLRELILRPAPSYPSRIFEFVDEKNIFHWPTAGYEDSILEAFADEDGTRDIRHIAWTNRVVDLWNDKIRDKVYGFDREEWTKGEEVVTTAPVLDRAENSIIFTTDTLLTIQREPEIVTHLDIECWKLYARNQPLLVPTKKGMRDFSRVKAIKLEEAKQDKRKWRFFYEFMEAFARIKPAFSMTTHRSQGSTFDEVFISYQNILQNPNRKESLQCLYVAITRPRQKLYLV